MEEEQSRLFDKLDALREQLHTAPIRTKADLKALSRLFHEYHQIGNRDPDTMASFGHDLLALFRQLSAVEKIAT